MKWMIILILLVLVEMTMGQTKDSWKGRGNTDRKIDGLEIERREAMGFGVVHINGEKMEPVHFSKLYTLWETDKEKVERRRAELVAKVFPTGVLDRLRKIEGQEGNPLATIFDECGSQTEWAYQKLQYYHWRGSVQCVER